MGKDDVMVRTTVEREAQGPLMAYMGAKWPDVRFRYVGESLLAGIPPGVDRRALLNDLWLVAEAFCKAKESEDGRE